MPVYKEMDPELAWKIIEGYPDELGPAAKAQEALYRQFRCGRCKGDLQKKFDRKHTFSDSESLIGRALLECPTCEFLIDPHSGIILNTGNPSKVPRPDTIPIVGQD